MSTDSRIADIVSNNSGKWISLEFFPPRTEAGVTSLHKLIEKLKIYNPQFVDFTWGAGGSTSSLTLELCVDTKLKHGLVPNLHLTCTNMEVQKIHDALAGCIAAGITNIVALRGDPPAGQSKWEITEGGFSCALDLVKHIRSEHGDYFNLSISGYPEGHPDAMSIVDDINTLTPSELARCAHLPDENGNIVITVCKDEQFEKELNYLLEKVQAGASCIITQMFFDVNVFLTFVKACRMRGITIPIIPGIMCIASKAGFERMTKFCKIRVPSQLAEDIKSMEDDNACKALGIRYGTEMSRQLLANGIDGLHFYTLNMGLVTMGILDNLIAENLIPASMAAEEEKVHEVANTSNVPVTNSVFEDTVKNAVSSTSA